MGSWNKLQTTFRNSTGLPEGRFNGRKRLPMNLRGTFTENRDHSDPQTPQDIRGTLRKLRSQVPRSSRGNGLRSKTTSQRSPTRQKGLGTLGSVHGRLDLPLRSPMSPLPYRAMAGASVPTPFSPSCCGRHLSGPSTRSFQPSLTTLKATSPTLFLVHRG
ncbi:hypothetical protein CRG98_013810 [Punica granatum]|uniref:Uncharacterized protein n=1 Tax=Punica granatum TaxID=22663 RepID=A0A2I0KBB0_PUNGR|nr:hypothetical protein CRG98_013810 [Punica granatum]